MINKILLIWIIKNLRILLFILKQNFYHKFISIHPLKLFEIFLKDVCLFKGNQIELLKYAREEIFNSKIRTSILN